MGKRKPHGRASNGTSKESTPVQSDSDESEKPTTKKQKTAKKQGPKSSAELCSELKLKDVELSYTEADYQNLTTFSLFSRMVRPQISAANSGLASNKMAQIMEAKWREFREANPLKSPENRRDPLLLMRRCSFGKDKSDDEGDKRSKSSKSSAKKKHKPEISNIADSDDSEIAFNITPKSSGKKSSLKKSSASRKVESDGSGAGLSDSDDDTHKSRTTSRKRQKQKQVIKKKLDSELEAEVESLDEAEGTSRRSARQSSRKSLQKTYEDNDSSEPTGRHSSFRKRVKDKKQASKAEADDSSPSPKPPSKRKSHFKTLLKGDDYDDEEANRSGPSARPSSGKKNERKKLQISLQDSDDDIQSESDKTESEEDEQDKKKSGGARSSSRKNASQKKPPTIKYDDEDDDEDMEDGNRSGPSVRPSSGKRNERKKLQISVQDSDDDIQSESDKTESEDGEEDKKKRKKSGGGLKIRLPIFGIRKSTRERKEIKRDIMSDRDFKRIMKEDGNDSAASSDRGRRATAKRKKQWDGDSGDDTDEDDGRQKRSRPKPRSKDKKIKKVESDEDHLSSGRSSDGSSLSDSDSSLSDDSKVASRRKRQTSKKKVEIPGERKSDRAKKNVSSTMTDREFEKLLVEEEKVKEEKKRKKAAQKKKDASKKSAEKKLKEEKLAHSIKKGYWQADKDADKGADKDADKDTDKDTDKDSPEKDDAAGKEAEKDNKEGGESGNESDHFWYCEVCKDGGDLMLCDTCPRSFHQSCLKLEDVPEGDWSCPLCTGEGLAEQGDSEEEHDSYCKICKDAGECILCDFCPLVFHMHCLNPPLTQLPDGDWKCPWCRINENPLKAKVTRILTWRWSHQLKDVDELDHTQSPVKKDGADKSNKAAMLQTLKVQNEDSKDSTSRASTPQVKPYRELFVKYEYHSYWDCDWVSELELEVHQPMTYKSFVRRWDQEEAPALEDGSSFGRKRHKQDRSSDPFSLEETYYRYGIKPEWMQIHRIVSHDVGAARKDTRYLVLWRDLQYEDCTFEQLQDVQEALKDEFRRHTDIYWDRRKERMNKDKMEPKRKEKPKKSALKKKLEQQPDYLGVQGMKLHPYQLEGLNWMRFSFSQGTNTILADEMGLGKTIQAISILYALWKEGYCPGPFMVTAPLSTVANWEREFELWAPEMYVVTYVGGRANTAIIREHEFCYKEGAFPMLSKPSKMRKGYEPKFDVLLSSYEYPSSDHTTLASIQWSVLVIDEAHRLKNNQSLFFRTLSDFKLDYKLLLTGTPLQNNLEELFNLLNFLEPGKFDDMEGFLENFSEISKDDQVLRLHEMLAPHMLRRLKVDVLKDIPSKNELIVRVELSPMQKKFYKHILTKNYSALNVRGHANQTSLINIMMDLRKCCNHPYLFPVADQEAPLLKTGLYEGCALIKACGKLELMAKMLKVLKRDGHRVLIFSQMTRCLDILEDFLSHMQFQYERIDGNISGPARQVAIDRFNSENSPQFVFLLSTKAGGLGINLATADTVIIYDMDWNPHNDIQAFSRAHRIGQKNKVLIFRFVSRNTIEEKMTQVCKQKMMLTELVIHKGLGAEKKDSLTKMEVSDIIKFGADNLFNDEEGEVVYDMAAVEKLVDREQKAEGESAAEADDKDIGVGLNDYLRSFKVASYHIKEDAVEANEEEEEAVVEEEEPEPEKEQDAAYWQRVLGDSYVQHMEQLHKESEELARTLGKGKRVRKQINYAEAQNPDAANLQNAKDEKRREGESREEILRKVYLSDYEPTSESSSDAETADEEDSTAVVKKKEKSHKVYDLPPLLARVNGNIEVLGFTARQRRSFMDAVMRFGMPPDDPYKSQLLVRDIRTKPERVFKAYASLFMRHLCEPVADDALVFADGVPREGLSRHHVLTRIGIIALIRRKVAEFEEANGIDSMKEFNLAPRIINPTKPPVVAELEKRLKENGDESLEGELAADGEEKQKVEKKDVEATEGQKEEESKSKDKLDEKEPEKKDEDEKSTGLDKGKPDEQKDEDAGEEKSDGKAPEKKAVADGEERKEETMETDQVDEKVDHAQAQKEESEKDNNDTTDAAKDEGKEEGEDAAAEVKKDLTDSCKGGDNNTEDGSEVKKEGAGAETEAAQGESEPGKEGSEVGKEESTVSQAETVTETAAEETEVIKDDAGHSEDLPAKDDNVDEATEKEVSEAPCTPDKEDKPVDDDPSVTTEESGDTKPEKEQQQPQEAMDVDEEGKNEENTETEPEKGDHAMEEDVKETGDDPAEEAKSKEGSAEKSDQEAKVKTEEGKTAEEVTDKDGAEEKSSQETKEEEKNKIAKENKPEEEEKKQQPTEKAKETSEAAPDDEEEKKKAEKKPVVKKSFLQLTSELRKRLWIADGGFTELHALWQVEEMQMEQEKEYFTWHRRHDFWLLAGVATHGYRHWQDIVNDPRFEIINMAFTTDERKLRKAAFLNRRFQLLEQGLVIEEQLRKAVGRNEGAPEASPTSSLTLVDDLSVQMRKVNQGQGVGSANKKVHKLINKVAHLVTDIKQATYTSMPATLAPPPKPKQQQQAARHQPKPGSSAHLMQHLATKASKPTTVAAMMKQRKANEVICLD